MSPSKYNICFLTSDSRLNIGNMTSSFVAGFKVKRKDPDTCLTISIVPLKSFLFLSMFLVSITGMFPLRYSSREGRPGASKVFKTSSEISIQSFVVTSELKQKNYGDSIFCTILSFIFLTFIS